MSSHRSSPEQVLLPKVQPGSKLVKRAYVSLIPPIGDGKHWQRRQCLCAALLQSLVLPARSLQEEERDHDHVPDLERAARQKKPRRFRVYTLAGARKLRPPLKPPLRTVETCDGLGVLVILRVQLRTRRIKVF